MSNFSKNLASIWESVKQNPEFVTTPLGAALGLVIARKTKDPDDSTLTPEVIGTAAGGALGFGAGRIMKGMPFSKPAAPKPEATGELGGNPKPARFGYARVQPDQFKLPSKDVFDKTVDLGAVDIKSFTEQPWVARLQKVNPRMFQELIFYFSKWKNSPEHIAALKNEGYAMFQKMLKPPPAFAGNSGK